MSEIAQLGIQVKTEGLDQASAGLDKLAESSDRAQKATDKLQDSGTKVKKATGDMGSGSEEASMAFDHLSTVMTAFAFGAGIYVISSLEKVVEKLREVVIESVNLAIEDERMAIAMRVVGENAGWTAEQLEKTTKALEASNIPLSKSDDIVTRLAAAHLSAADSTKLLTVAQNLSVPANLSVAETMDRLTTAIITGNGRTLLSLKVHADFTAALQKEADAVHKLPQFLTDSERAQANLNAEIEAAAGYTNVYAQTQDTAATNIQHFRTVWEDLQAALGATVLPAVNIALEVLITSLQGLAKLLYDVKNSGFVEYMGNAAKALGDAAISTGNITKVNLSGWVANNVIKLLEFSGVLKNIILLLREVQVLHGGWNGVPANAGAGSGAGSTPNTGLPFAGPQNATVRLPSPADMRAMLSNVPSGTYTGPPAPAATNITDPFKLPNGLSKDQLKETAKNITTLADTFEALFKQTDNKGARIIELRESSKHLGETFKALKDAEANISKLPADQQATVRAQVASTMGSKQMPTAEQVAQAKVAVDAQIAQLQKGYGSPGKKPPTDVSDQAIARALQDQLKAQLVLNKNVQDEADLKKKIVDTELRNQLQTLAQEVHDKRITQAAATMAAQSLRNAALAKDEQIDREAVNETNKRILDHQKTIADYQSRADKASADFAPTIEANVKLQEDILARTQKTEMARKVEDDRIAVQNRTKDASIAAQEESELKHAQLLETQNQSIKDRIDIIHTNAAHEQQMEQIDVNSLQRAQAAADTETQKTLIGLEILKHEQAIERNKAQEDVAAAIASGIQQNISEALARQQHLIADQANDLTAALGSSSQIFNNLNSSLAGVGAAARAHNWSQLWDNLDKTISEVIKGLKSAQEGTGKLSTVIGGLISGIGGMIGGSAGGFLSGVGGGLKAIQGLGSTLTSLTAKGGLGGPGGILGSIAGVLGGPWGAVAGGVIGGIASLFGGGKTAQQRRQEENQAAQDAIAGQQQKAEALQNERRQLELRLVQASGDKIATLTAQRADEVEKLDASDKALAQQVYTAEDAMSRHQSILGITVGYLNAIGDSQGALNKQREEELKDLDPLLKSLQKLSWAAGDATSVFNDAQTALTTASNDLKTSLQQLHQATLDAEAKITDAQNALKSAYNTNASALQSVIDKFKNFHDSLVAFRKTLDVSSGGLSPENAYLATKKQFEDVNAQVKANPNDETARSQFQDMATAFLAASQNYFGVGPGFQKDLADVKSATEDAADSAAKTVSDAQQQLDALKQLVSGYVKLDESVLSVHDAITNLTTAQQAAKIAEQAEQNAHMIAGPLFDISNGIIDFNTAFQTYTQAFSAFTMAQSARDEAMQAFMAELNKQNANPANQPSPAPPPGTTGITPQGYTSTHGDFAAYVEGNPDLLALYRSNSGMARGRTETEFGTYQWANFGQTEKRPVRPYQFGGEFKVGGQGTTDSQQVSLRASPDENVTVRTPQQMANDNAAQEHMAQAIEDVGKKLDALIFEAKVDKTQFSDGVKIVQAGFNDMKESFETFKRRSAKSS